MTEYAQVARELARVRRAWRRSTSLAGLAAWLLETLGLFSVAILANVLFDLHTVTRMLMLGAVVACSAAFFVWKVIRPWLRKVSDEDVALFVESTSPGFEGAMMAAAEFGPNSAEWRRHRQLVQLIIDAAVDRARAWDIRSGLRASLRKLHKYGVALLVLAGVFVAVSVMAPEHVQEHAIRVVNPFWKKPAPVSSLTGTGRDARRLGEEAAPLRVTALWHAGERLAGAIECPRGSSVPLQAILSRAPAGLDEPVEIYFRPATAGNDARWDRLAMHRIEKLFGYGITLTDVSEDLEFYVSAAQSPSERYRIRVYDPLAVEQFRIVTKHPSYLDAPPTEATEPSANVRALTQSRVTIDVRANNRLTSGLLRWEDQSELKGDPDIGDGRTLRVAFDVTDSTAFRMVLRDAHGQELETGMYVVEALEDLPPTVRLDEPRSDVATSPLGEMDFAAHADDDIALEAVNLVYINGADPSSVPQRVPLTLETLERHASGGGLPAGGAAAVEGTLTLELESFEGGDLTVGDMVSWYLEARDRKGQTAVTDVHFVYVRPYEEWAFMAVTPGGEELWSLSKPTTFADPISKWVAAAWNLRTEKRALARDEYVRRCRELGEKLRRSIGYLDGEEPE